MTITLFYSPGACSLAPHIALEEAGLAHETVPVPVRQGAQLKPEYLAINPRARVPALKTDRGVLTECPAILTWIARQAPEAGLLPSDPWDEAQALSWMAFCSSSVHIAFAQVWRAGRFAEDEAVHPNIQATGRAALSRFFADIEGRLPEEGFVLGRFSVVDPYLLVFWLWANRIELPLDGCPRYRALAGRILARPAVRRTLEAEGLPLPA